MFCFQILFRGKIVVTLFLPQNKITSETNLKFVAVLSPKIKIFSWTSHGRITSKSYSAATFYFAAKYSWHLFCLQKKCSRLNSEICSTLNIKFFNQMFYGRIIIETYSAIEFYFAKNKSGTYFAAKHFCGRNNSEI